MWLFKIAMTFFFSTLIGFVLCWIAMDNQDFHEGKERKEYWRKWVLRFGIGVAFFLWLSIVGLIWH